jgi:hypothetical protein
MNAWRLPCTSRGMTTPERYRENQSVRRDAWRIQLFHEQIAEEAAARRRAEAKRAAVIIGIVLGVVASVVIYI